MEADWEVEIGGGAPIIDACWPGLIHLQSAPKRAAELPEAADLPGLAEALVRLNGSRSPVWTSKCDVWPVLDATDIDAGELDAPQEEATFAWACYIDLVPLNGSWPSLATEEPGSWVGRGFIPGVRATKSTRPLGPEVCFPPPSHSPKFRGLSAARLTDAAAQWCQQLRSVPLTHCRADLIIRQAIIAPDQMDHGVTAYLTACGRTSEEANATLARALEAFANTLCPDSTVE